MIGYKTRGRGYEKVLVLHDWFSDCTSYEAVTNHLDIQKYTFVFMDMRGYGQSKTINGICSMEEAAQDALALVDRLKWDRFHLVCHSMSSLAACHMMVQDNARIQKVVAITPVPPCGSPAPEDVVEFLETAALGNKELATQIIHFMTGHRLAEAFIAGKVANWFSCSAPEARVAYLHAFTQTDLSNQIKGMLTPILTLSGAYDAEGYGEDVMRKTFGTWFANHTHKTLPDCGHFPMQEIPEVLAAEIQNFL